MIIFSDRHHDGLAFSLRLLAKRLGAEIYFPIGEEWFTKGYWDIAKPYQNDLNTVAQYLRIKPEHRMNTSWYDVLDTYHEDEYRCITFQQFLDMDIDVIIASVPDHWVTYTKLRDTYKPKAKVICQSGNIGWEDERYIREGVVKNLLASTREFLVSHAIHKVFYHQEQPVVPYEGIGKTGKISSYIHLLPAKEQYEEYKKSLPEFVWSAYGASSPDGWQPTLSLLYASMQQNDYIYHVKPGGDGYGWNWHSAFMLGRPVITNFSDYIDKLGASLFQHGITGIDLERGSVQENCEIIRRLHDEDRVQEMGIYARKRWEEVVNYDEEEKKLKKFFDELI